MLGNRVRLNSNNKVLFIEFGIQKNCLDIYLSAAVLAINLTITINGASEGNRTPVSTLARSRSPIELHLQDGGPDEDRTRDLLRDREAC